MADEEGRPDLRSLLGGRPERLFHVGRLDTDTDGLIVLTNDGEFAHRLAHPSYELPKTYVAQVEGVVRPTVRALLLAGVDLEDGRWRSTVHGDVTQPDGPSGTLDRRAGHPRGPQPDRAAGCSPRSATRCCGCRGRRSGRSGCADCRPGRVRELTPDELGTLLDAVGL